MGISSKFDLRNLIVSKNGKGGGLHLPNVEQKRDNSNITTFLKFRDTPYPSLPLLGLLCMMNGRLHINYPPKILKGLANIDIYYWLY